MSEIIKKKIGEISKSVKYVNNISSPVKIKKIVDVPIYTTNGEYLIVIKDVESCELFLNKNTTESIKIKVLTPNAPIPTFRELRMECLGKIEQLKDMTLHENSLVKLSS